MGTNLREFQKYRGNNTFFPKFYTSSKHIALSFTAHWSVQLKTLVKPLRPISHILSDSITFKKIMLIRRVALTTSLHHYHLRFFSNSAAAAVLPDPEPEFPKPDPKYDETIHAIARAKSGKNIAAKERKAGRVPSIVFEQEDGQHGGNKRLISVQANQIRKLVNHLGRSHFLSRLFDLEVRPDFDSVEVVEKVRVLPRKVLFGCIILGFVILN